MLPYIAAPWILWFQWFLHRRFFRFSFFSRIPLDPLVLCPPSAPSHCWKVPSPDRHQALCAPRCSPLGPLRYFSSAGDRFADMGCSGHCLECGKDGPKLGGSCWIFDSQIDQSVREKKKVLWHPVPWVPHPQAPRQPETASNM